MLSPPPLSSSASNEPADFPQKKGFFAKKDSPSPLAGASTQQEDLSVLARRLKLLEERYSRIENNLATIEEHMNSVSRDFSRHITTMKADLGGSSRSIEQMQERMLSLIKEIDLLAKKEDVQVIQKYLKYWDPVHFVQVKHVEKIVKDTLIELGIYKNI